MQKAQTKRWLKNEYGVALRAGLEEELEQVCASATMVLSRELSDACAALLEEHEDALVRGVLDGERLAPCYAAIAGCTAGTVDAAVERFKRDVRSAPESRPTPSGSPAPTARCGASSATPSPTTCCACRRRRS